MGYDIWAGDYWNTANKDNEIYLRKGMGGFRRLALEGCDWFSLIDAMECDGGVSGNGTSKFISKENIEKTISLTKTFKPDTSDGYYEFENSKDVLLEFMEKCINWCNKNDMESIPISFG